MGIGLNIITSNEASKWVQDSAFQVLSEGTLKAAGRPAFTLLDSSASMDARKYSATKEFIFQAFSMAMYFAIITTVFQKMGFKALRKLPKFKDFETLKDIKSIEEFSKVFDNFSKGNIQTTPKQTKELQQAKGGMEIIKMIGSGLILTILCPLLVAKMVSPVMKGLQPILNPNTKNNNQKIDTKA